MTRSWNFILPIPNVWYNLWTLITQDPSYGTKTAMTPYGYITVPDNDFSFHPFTPSNVKGLKYQSQNAIVNSNNGGAIIKKTDDLNLESGFELLSGSWDGQLSELGNISLKSIAFQTSIGGAGINVETVF